MPPTLADLQSELAASTRALVIVGTGVTLAATAGTAAAPLASWDGLLRHGIDHATRFGRRDAPWAAALRSRLDSPNAATDTATLLAVAAEVCAALAAPGLGEYSRWLQDTVGSFRAAHPDELSALRDLGLPLATTNYDSLLEDATGLPPATWQDTAAIEDLLRGKPPRAILHLHGHWQRPDSVILDPAAYRRAAPVVQDLLKALRLTHTLLFVGCGAGLADPSWSSLLRWSRDILPASRYRHFRLCRTADLPDLERQHPPAERLFPVAYGPDFSDLTPFLRQLRPPPPPTALPLPPAPSCFGRDEPVDALVAALCTVPPRPTAVLGPPGVGKTTVTLVALHHPRVAARFADRRYFVRCAAAASRDTLLNALALALRLDLAPAAQLTDLETRIVSHLAAAPALLLLDNAETPWEADPGGFEDLLARLTALPEVALAASLRGAERPIGPAWRETIALDLLAPIPARDTFLAIAGDAHHNDPLLDTLLASVGHLPLALVLLAAQAQGVPLSSLWYRWQQEKSRLLQRAGGGSPATSLELSISLSLESPRLTPEARHLAALLALLPDGMAAEDLHALEPDHGEASSARLRKVGLALPLDPRLRLYSPIREVLATTLPPAAEEHERLLTHYLDLAETGERAGTEEGFATFQRLGPELGNLEALITPALQGPKAEPAISAVLALIELARFTGIQQSALFESALATARSAHRRHTLARCLYRLGDLSLARFDHEAARARYEEALPLFRREGDHTSEANCIKGLGDIALDRSDPAADRRFEQALALYRGVGDLLGEANCVVSLGDIALQRSDHDAARTRYEQAHPLYHRVGDLLGEANCIRRLGDIALDRSDYDTARICYEAALPFYRRIGDLLGEANCTASLGDIAVDRFDHCTASARYEEALPLYRRVGHLLGEASCIQSLGTIALRIAEKARALSLFEQALDLYARIPEPYSIGWTHRHLARLTRAERRDQHLQAARAAWEAIDRTDLIAALDREFPPDLPSRVD